MIFSFGRLTIYSDKICRCGTPALSLRKLCMTAGRQHNHTTLRKKNVTKIIVLHLSSDSTYCQRSSHNTNSCVNFFYCCRTYNLVWPDCQEKEKKLFNLRLKHGNNVAGNGRTDTPANLWRLRGTRRHVRQIDFIRWSRIHR